MVFEVTGSHIIKYHPEGEGEGKPELTVDFTPPFKRVSMIDGLEEATGRPFPKDLASPEARTFLSDVCAEYGCGHARRVDCEGVASDVLATAASPPPPSDVQRQVRRAAHDPAAPRQARGPLPRGAPAAAPAPLRRMLHHRCEHACR